MLEFLPKRNHPDDPIFLLEKDRKKLRKAIKDLILEQPHLTVKEIGERSIGESTLRRLLNSRAVSTIVLERQRSQLRKFFHDATHIAFDRGAVRQFIDALGEQYKIPRREIARLCGMTNFRIRNIVSPSRNMRFMELQEGRALWGLPEHLEREDVEFSERYHYQLRDSEFKFPLDKNQLRQFIDAMRTKFHVTISTIIKEYGVNKTQLFNLLTPKGLTYIRTKVAQTLWELPERLEERDFPIDQRGFRRVIEPDEKAGRVELNKDQLDQFINALCEKFQGLSIQNIAKLCGMHEARLSGLLKRKKKYPVQCFIRPAEMAALWNLPERLLEGKVSYVPSRSAHGVRKISVDKQNLRQYIDFLLDTFDGLTMREIQKMCDLSSSDFFNLLNDGNRYMIPSVARALWDLPHRIRNGEVAYEPSRYSRSGKRKRVSFKKECVHQWVDVIAERYSLTREAVGRILDLTRSRFGDIMYRRRHNLLQSEAEALWNLPERLQKGEIDIKAAIVKRGRLRRKF